MNPELIPPYDCQPVAFNQRRFRENLSHKPAFEVFKESVQGMNTHLAIRFKEGEDARSLIKARSDFIDLILYYAWHQYQWDEDISLIAVGGYGRKELHPHSDIDLLILLADASREKYDDQLRTLVSFFWDIGLEVGCSVRTLSECEDIAREDITVATNLLESRTVAGSNTLRSEIQRLTGPEFMWPMAEFFDAKWEEQVERHERHNNTECNLEPNVKSAPGGLRDLQMIKWVAKRYFCVQTLSQLEGKGFFTEAEYNVLSDAEQLLWTVRFGLHVITGRSEERLLFEYQRELATLFGYKDSERGLAVEQFMQKYYRAVISLRELNDVLLQYLRERIHQQGAENTITKINDRFQLRDNFIEVTSRSVFDKYPSALLEIFVIMGNSPNIAGVRASTIRLIRDKRHLIDHNFRAKAENKRMFLALFSIKYGLVTQLARMKHYGVLGRYLPAFEKITGQMQHDLFHRYTVDAHTLHVIKNLRRFTLEEEEQRFPIATHILRHMEKPEILYLAGLFHDIAKGRGGDHSSLGVIDAKEFGVAHGIGKQDTSLLCWLVKKHLLMSHVSQKKDISDPDVVREFALEVKDQNRLDYLYALTVADMCATNPEIWNSWRDSLMRQLYLETKRALRRGLETKVNKREYIRQTKLLSLQKLKDKNISEARIKTLWQGMGDEYFIRESHNDIALQTEALLNHDGNQPLVLVHTPMNAQRAGATQIFVWEKDGSDLFLVLTSCIAKLGLNIQSAKLYRNASGHNLDSFYVLDENFEPDIGNSDTHTKVRETILTALNNRSDYAEKIVRMTSRELKQFGVPTETRISNDIVNGYTVLDVVTPDRPGLLVTIAKAFVEEGITVHNAKILTLGERVEDIFYITDRDGNALSDPEVCAALQDKIRRRIDRQIRKETSNGISH